MSVEPCTVVRDFRPEDREAAIQVLAASLEGFGSLDQVVGYDDKAPDRRRRMLETTFKEVGAPRWRGRLGHRARHHTDPEGGPAARESPG